jgi:hypothetical protein
MSWTRAASSQGTWFFPWPAGGCVVLNPGFYGLAWRVAKGRGSSLGRPDVAWLSTPDLLLQLRQQQATTSCTCSFPQPLLHTASCRACLSCAALHPTISTATAGHDAARFTRGHCCLTRGLRTRPTPRAPRAVAPIATPRASTPHVSRSAALVAPACLAHLRASTPRAPRAAAPHAPACLNAALSSRGRPYRTKCASTPRAPRAAVPVARVIQRREWSPRAPQCRVVLRAVAPVTPSRHTPRASRAAAAVTPCGLRARHPPCPSRAASSAASHLPCTPSGPHNLSSSTGLTRRIVIRRSPCTLSA